MKSAMPPATSVRKYLARRQSDLPAASEFALLIVAGDPEILRGVQHGEDAAAIARLRNPIGGVQLEQRGQNEPEKLRE